MITKEQLKHTYPDALIKKCQDLISERSGKKINTDETELHLDRMSRLGMIFIKGAFGKMEQDEAKKKKANGKKKAGI